jgi:uncharacterized protein (DUF1330 family)
MKTAIQLSLVGALGVLAGASAMQVLHAETASLPGYVVMNIETVNDEATYNKYRSVAGKSRVPFGGHPIVAHAKPVALDSSPLPKGEILIFQFPSLKAAQGWWNSPELVAAQPLRAKSIISTAYALEGTTAP